MEPEALTKGALTALDALTEKLKGVKGLPLELQVGGCFAVWPR